MTWAGVALAVSTVSGLILIVRILWIPLHRVYRVFCLYLLFEILSSVLLLSSRFTGAIRLDYRIEWIGIRCVAWFLTLWLVYSLLDSILTRLPGVLRFSRLFLAFAFSCVLIVSVLAAQPQYRRTPLSLSDDPIQRALGFAYILERGMAVMSLLLMAIVLAFTLWFPIRMPLNLALFTIGFVLFFTTDMSCLFLESLWPNRFGTNLGSAINWMVSVCYVSWTFLLSARGETVAVIIGHSWSRGEQQRIIHQLETINASLLKASQR